MQKTVHLKPRYVDIRDSLDQARSDASGRSVHGAYLMSPATANTAYPCMHMPCTMPCTTPCTTPCVLCVTYINILFWPETIYAFVYALADSCLHLYQP